LTTDVKIMGIGVSPRSGYIRIAPNVVLRVKQRMRGLLAIAPNCHVVKQRVRVKLVDVRVVIDVPVDMEARIRTVSGACP
jgi:hypothetical protein